MKGESVYVVMFVALFVVLGACAPKATPTTAPAPVAPRAATPLPAPVAPVISAEEAAWQKVVQAAKREGRLTVYDAQGLVGAYEEMAKVFADRYGIKVDFISGMAELVERLKTEQRMGQMVGDVFASSTTQVMNTKKEGLTTKLIDLPELQKKDVWEIQPSALDPDGHMVIYSATYMSPWINTKLVRREEAPQKYYDLLDPKWKDKKLVVSDPGVASSAYMVFVPLLNAKSLNMDFIAGLGKHNLWMETSATRAIGVVARGEAPIALPGASSSSNQMVANGASIAPLAMEEGTTVSNTLVAVMAAAPHPNSAQLFANWILTVEGQETFNRAKSMRSIRKDVRDYSPIWVTPRRLVVTTVADTNQMAVMFREKAWVDLWKK